MASYTPKHEPDHELEGYPKGIPYIIGNEGCERFSYYGMKAILALYMVGLYINLRGMDADAADKEATAAMHTFGAAVYALPMIGALISDRLLGKYVTILTLSVVYCLGHLALALFETSAWQEAMFGQVFLDPIQGLYVGLGLIALGSGGIKPCVSAHVGDQFGRSNWHLLQKVYNAFYFIINFGSAFATIFIPVIRGDLIVDDLTGHYSYTNSVGWAFGVPGILMGLATIAFWMGRKVFIHVPPTHPGVRGLLDVASGTLLFMVVGHPMFFHGDAGLGETLAICAAYFVGFVVLFAIRQRIEEDDGFLAMTFYGARTKLLGGDPGAGEAPAEGRRDLRDHWLYGPAARKWSSELAEGPVAVWKIISVFLMVAVFWALFDQHGSTWIIQARDMDRLIEFDLMGWLGVGSGLGLIVGLAFMLTLGKTPAKRLLMMLVGLVVGLGIGFLLHTLGPTYEPQASQVPAVNPFLVMILIPLTTFGLYPLMEKVGVDPHPLRRMAMGMFMAALSFVAVAMIQSAMDSAAETGGKVHVGWQLVPYVIITLAEVMVSITGLEFAYSQAPKRMKSVIMGFWLFCISLGNVLVVFLAGFEDLPKVDFFWTFAGLMAAAATLFGLRGKLYQYQDYTQ